MVQYMQLRGGAVTSDPRLDRVPSETTEHLERYPLTIDTIPSVATSMIAGINWYDRFFYPTLMSVGRHRNVAVIANDGQFGLLAGGHCVCLRHQEIYDLPGWKIFYNQLNEGRCVEFATLRMLSHSNRRRYDITSHWHYWEMQKRDEWSGGSYPGATPQYEGTSGRAGLLVASQFGAVKARRGGLPIAYEEAQPDPLEGISAYRWAPTWDHVRAALAVPEDQAGVFVCQSWGDPYQWFLPDEVGTRLLDEYGEFGIVTDR